MITAPQRRTRLSATSRRLGSTALLGVVLSMLVTVLTLSPARASNPVTPGDFTGYGFDQCNAPDQRAMTNWMNYSPYSAVGIYISGDSRYCRTQANLTPTWVATQLAAGWRLLPITLGPQAWCTTNARYLKQVRINPTATSGYSKARAQGRAEAAKAVQAAQALGIPAKSTLWYDIEAFNIRKSVTCTHSVLWFLSAWTNQLHKLGYVSGVYSSAASGIKILDDSRVNTSDKVIVPDRIWIADWNDRASVYSTYIRNDGWMPHARVHQYQGGHNEKHGGVTINIDRNWIDLGRGSTMPAEKPMCDDVSISLPSYVYQGPRVHYSGGVKALKCLLSKRGLYDGALTGVWNSALQRGIWAYQAKARLPHSNGFTHSAWVRILSEGMHPVLKYGSHSEYVRRIQRALNAAGHWRLPITGVFDSATTAAVKEYQANVGIFAAGVVNPVTWSRFATGQL